MLAQNSFPAFARAIRHGPARLLHPARRRRAIRALRNRGAPISVLFVCYGNRCRSPYAAAIFARALRDSFRSAVEVSSAGFVGPGRPPPRTAIRVARRRGLDLSSHRSVLLMREDIHEAELVVVMEVRQRRWVCRRFGCSRHDVLVLGDLDPWRIETRTILDPLGRAEAAFEASFDRIDRCVGVLVAVVAGGSAEPRPALSPAPF